MKRQFREYQKSSLGLENFKNTIKTLYLPALQWTIGGPTSFSKLPLLRTAFKYSRNVSHCGTSKSAHAV